MMSRWSSDHFGLGFTLIDSLLTNSMREN